MAASTQVTATLDGILNLEEAAGGRCSIQLCGYGSQVPRIAGIGMIAEPQALELEVDPAGQIQVTLYSNDGIDPPTTYYTFTFMNKNGDIVQVNAYRFAGFSSIDLSTLSPYDPNQPPPQLPPLVTNQLLIMGAADDMVFDGSIYTAFQTTLPGDVLIPSIQNMVPGNLYTFIIQQDGAGNHLFVWPLNIYNAARVSSEPWDITIQTFVADGNGNLYAIAGGTYWP